LPGERLVLPGKAAVPVRWQNRMSGIRGPVRLGVVMATVEIRPAVDADLAALVASLQERDFFADALARQRDGRGVLLVA
jgi:hypothetical protein